MMAGNRYAALEVDVSTVTASAAGLSVAESDRDCHSRVIDAFGGHDTLICLDFEATCCDDRRDAGVAPLNTPIVTYVHTLEC